MKVITGFLLVVLATTSHADETRLLALCYHDVVAGDQVAELDGMSVTVGDLTRQFAWLQSQGYQPISLDQWVAAGDGGALPEKPVILTFDDGYASFAELVMPLLKVFDYPAVLAPVTSWIDAPAGGMVDYGGELVPRERFLTWEQLSEVADSGLVEIATHTHDLHRGLVGNPYLSEQPAAVTRIWDASSATYESETDYEKRIHEDLQESVRLITRHVGRAPQTVVWPYGAYGSRASAIAASLGLERTLTLDPRPNELGRRNVHRRLVGFDTSMFEFVMTARSLYQDQPVRAAHVNLDDLYDADPATAEANLDRLLDRIKAMQLTNVFLQAFADQDGDGAAEATYFPNRHLPMRADLFNRVAWQLKTRAEVEVFAWMPVLAFELPDSTLNDALAVQAYGESGAGLPHRLSPFNAHARSIVREIYDDLGRSSRFLGVLFHDDAVLSDREDVSPAALVHYRDEWGIDVDGPSLIAGPELTRRKTEFLIEFTLTLADQLRVYQPALFTARSIRARPVADPDSEKRFAQSLADFQHSYDYTAIIAMPYLESADDQGAWLAPLVAKVKASPGGLQKTLFELQTVDRKRNKALPAATLARHMDLLLDRGVRHIAYYPDDFLQGYPPLPLVRSRLSLNDHPALKD